MGEVLERHVCDAGHRDDMVGLMFGPHRVSMFYQTAFKVASAVLVASKMSARYEGMTPRRSQEIMVDYRRLVDEPLNREYRRSLHLPNFKEWEVLWDRNLVIFRFDDTRIKMHYASAYEIYGLIRMSAQNAKRWAGDRSRHWSTQAYLADAEHNDKFVYTQQ